MGYVDNTGHGPGYRYDRPVGPRGGISAVLTIILVIGFVLWLLGV